MVWRTFLSLGGWNVRNVLQVVDRWAWRVAAEHPTPCSLSFVRSDWYAPCLGRWLLAIPHVLYGVEDPVVIPSPSIPLRPPLVV